MDELQTNVRMMNGVAAAGKKGLAWLIVPFDRTDENRDGLVSYGEFSRAMEAVHWLSSREKQALFLSASRGTGRNEIAWRTFLRRLAGDMSPKRSDFLRQLFTKIFVSNPKIQQVEACLRDADRHRVVEALSALGLFQPHLDCKGFLDYYCLEACLQSDDQFESEVTALWRASASTRLAEYKGNATPLALAASKSGQHPSQRDQSVIDACRRALKASGGLQSFIALARKWRSADREKSGFLNETELCACAQELSSQCEYALRALILLYPNESYEFLLDCIRGNLISRRRSLVEAAYRALDSDHSGRLDPKTLIENFSPQNHPEVLSGTKSSHDVFQYFVDTFDVGPLGIVRPQDFIEYYAAVSIFLDDDSTFERLVRGVWPLPPPTKPSPHISPPPPPPPPKKNQTLAEARRHQQADKIKVASGAFPAGVGAIVEGIRGAIAMNGRHGYHQLRRALRSRSELGLTQLMAALKEVGIENCGRRDLEAVFRSLVDNGEAICDPDLVYSAILPPVPQHRALLIRAAFDSLDASAGGKGYLLPSELADRYDAEAHPDARSGKTSAEALRTEFFENFELSPDGQVRRDDLEQYLFALSANEPDDAHFTALLSEVWHLDLTIAGQAPANKAQKIRLKISLADGRRLIDDLDDDETLRDLKGALLEKEALRRLQFQKGLNAIGVEEIVSGDTTNEAAPPVLVKTLANTLARDDESNDAQAVEDNVQKTTTRDELVAAAGPRGHSISRSRKSSGVQFYEQAPPPGVAAVGSRLTQELRGRGLRGFVALRRNFQSRADETGLLSLANFKAATRATGLDISESELRSLFSYVDADSSGAAPVEPCLDLIRPPMSRRRAALVDIAFRLLNADAGALDPSALAASFDAAAAPEVLAGRQTKEAAFDDFVSALVVDSDPYTGEARVTRKAFNDYHTDLSAAITDDAYFELFVRNAWHIETQHLVRAGLSDSDTNEDDIVVVARRIDGQQTVERLPGSLRGRLDLDDERAVVAALKDYCGIAASSAVSVTATTPNDAAIGADLKRGLAPNIAASGAANVQAAADLVARKFESRPRGKKIVGGLASKPTGGDSLPGKALPARRYQHSVASLRSQSEIDPGVAAIADRLRADLVSSRGIRGLVALDRKLRAASVDASNGLSRHLTLDELSRSARACELNLSGKELAAMFRACDRDGEGTVDYTEWLALIRPRLKGTRAACVTSAWRRIFGEVQQVAPQEIAQRYNAAAHPEVVAGRATADMVHREFLESFDIGDDVAGVATYYEFQNWHTALSATVSADDYFNLLVESVWSSAQVDDDELSKVETEFGSKNKSSKTAPLSVLARRRRREPTDIIQPAGAVLGQRDSIRDTFMNPTQLTNNDSRQRKFSERKAKTGDLRDVVGVERLLMDVRRQLARHGAHGIVSLGRKFRIIDDNDSKKLSMNEFRKATRELGLIELTDPEIRLIFSAMDTDTSGSINYEEFLAAVRGPMNERRRAIVNSAFELLDTDGSGAVDPAEIATKFDASQHPAVRKGERLADDVYREFLDQMDVGGEIDGKVTKEEFLRYYKNVSSSIDDDAYFESMMRNAWHLPAAENQLRVSITHADGTRSVCVLEDGLGLELPRDSADVIDRLRAQGMIDVVGVASVSASDDRAHFQKYQTNEPRTFREVAKTRAAGGGPRPSDVRHSGKKMNGYDNHGGMFSSQISLGGYDEPFHQKTRSPLPSPKVPATVCHLGFDMREKQIKTPDDLPINRDTAVGSLGRAIKRKDAGSIVDKLRARLVQMGARGICGIARKFRIADDNNSRSLSRSEFFKVLQETSLDLTNAEMDALFTAFDHDSSSAVDYEEFLHALRGKMSAKRRALVDQAFTVLDSDASGFVDIDDLVNKYDSSMHPDVLSTKNTSNEMYQEFLDTFECDGEVDGKVTLTEFLNYYENISASIDDDAYFELLIRNTWHISGGSGQAANTSNTRILVTHSDGTQSVETIEHDLGLDTKDSSQVISRLKRQGIDAISVSLYGAAETSKAMSNTWRTTFVLE